MKSPFKKNGEYNKKYIITMAVLAIVMFVYIVLLNINKTKSEVTLEQVDRALLPRMRSLGVETLVSDSGMIRYKMVAGEWEIYDKKKPSYWSFENGIHLERFDSLMNIDAYIDADTAYYYDKDKLWELRSNVKIENAKGEKFTTSLLFWNQVSEKVYSDEFITIKRGDQVLSGYGFESDQKFEDYDIRKTSGVIYLDDTEK